MKVLPLSFAASLQLPKEIVSKEDALVVDICAHMLP